jgi:hypothetical protein
MKQGFFALVALAVLASGGGCHLLPGQGKTPPGGSSCPTCGPGMARARGGHHHGGHLRNLPNNGSAMPVPAGPPSAQVAYPYYTTRGPRDFLNPNPPSIGY